MVEALEKRSQLMRQSMNMWYNVSVAGFETGRLSARPRPQAAQAAPPLVPDLMAGYLTADYLTAGYLTADYLTAGYLTAEHLTAEHLTADYLTASYLMAESHWLLSLSHILQGILTSCMMTWVDFVVRQKYVLRKAAFAIGPGPPRAARSPRDRREITARSEVAELGAVDASTYTAPLRRLLLLTASLSPPRPGRLLHLSFSSWRSLIAEDVKTRRTTDLVTQVPHPICRIVCPTHPPNSSARPNENVCNFIPAVSRPAPNPP